MTTISFNEFKKTFGESNTYSQEQDVKNNQTGNSNSGFFGGMKDTVSSISKGFTEDIPQRASNIYNAVKKAGTTGETRDVLSASLAVPGQIIGAAGDVLGRTVGPVAEAAENARGLISPSGELGQSIRDRLEGVVADYIKFKQDDPQSAQDIGNLFNIVSTLASVKPAGKALNATEKASQIVGGTLDEAGKQFLNTSIKVVKKVGDKTKTLGEYPVSRVPKLLGIFSGESDDVIQNALKNPEAARAGLASGDEALRNAVTEGSKNSIKLRNSFINGFTKAKDDVLGQYSKILIPKNNLKGEFNKLLKENKVIINKDRTLDFSVSPIIANPGEISKIQAAYKALDKWDKLSISSLDEYKQLVGKLTRFATEAGVPSKSPFLGTLYNKLNDIAVSKLPKDIGLKYLELNKKFSDNIGLYDDMVDVFNSGDPFTKLANALGKNKDSIRQLIGFYEQKSGKQVLPTVAGRELGMEKNAAFGFLNPRSWIDFFISPEKQGRIILKVGEKLKK